MQAFQEASYVRPQLELSLDEFRVKDGWIGGGRDGTTFAFTLGPVSDATVAALNDVAQKRGPICLHCGRQPLFFDPVAVKRKDLRSVRIVGRIVGGASDALRTMIL
jgi:hypothetical protein